MYIFFQSSQYTLELTVGAAYLIHVPTKVKYTLDGQGIQSECYT